MPHANRIKASQEIFHGSQGFLKGDDTFRSPCTSTVLGFFGITKKQFKYCQYIEDMQRIFRRDGWSMKKIQIKNGTPWHDLSDLLSNGFYVVSIDAHVFLISKFGQNKLAISVDTDPQRKYDYPAIDGIYKIKLKK